MQPRNRRVCTTCAPMSAAARSRLRPRLPRPTPTHVSHERFAGAKMLPAQREKLVPPQPTRPSASAPEHWGEALPDDSSQLPFNASTATTHATCVAAMRSSKIAGKHSIICILTPMHLGNYAAGVESKQRVAKRWVSRLDHTPLPHFQTRCPSPWHSARQPPMPNA